MKEIVTEINYLPLYELPRLPSNKEVVYRYLALINPKRSQKPSKKLGGKAKTTLVDEIFEVARTFDQPILSRAAISKRLQTLLSKRQNVFKKSDRTNEKTIADREAYQSILNLPFEICAKGRPEPLSFSVPSSSESDFDSTFVTETTYSHLIENEEVVMPQSQSSPVASTSRPYTNPHDPSIQSRLASLETIERRRITQEQFHQEIFDKSLNEIEFEQANFLKEEALKKLEVVAVDDCRYTQFQI